MRLCKLGAGYRAQSTGLLSAWFSMINVGAGIARFLGPRRNILGVYFGGLVGGLLDSKSKVIYLPSISPPSTT